MVLQLSGDISSDPGPPYNPQTDGFSWNVFDKKGMHFLHINVNSLLPKTEEIKFIAKRSTATAGSDLTTRDLYFTILVEVFRNNISAENKYFTNRMEWTEHKLMGLESANKNQIIRRCNNF